MMCKTPDVLLQDELLTRTTHLRPSNLQYLQFKFGTYHMYYKIDGHSSLSCQSTSGLLHIMGSNTMSFAVLKA